MADVVLIAVTSANFAAPERCRSKKTTSREAIWAMSNAPSTNTWALLTSGAVRFIT